MRRIRSDIGMGFDRERYMPQFAAESGRLISALAEGVAALPRRRERAGLLRSMSRDAHTLRGAAMMMGFNALADLAHALMTELDRALACGAVSGHDGIELLVKRLGEAREELACAISENRGAESEMPTETAEPKGRPACRKEEGAMTRKVLIIEDSATDAAIVKDLLEREGMKVEVASSGKEGIEKAIALKPDLIVLDLILPDISGFDVCERLKKEVRLSKAIVVVLSIKDNIDDITRAFHVGADDYIIKPPLPELLIRKIKLYLGIR